MAEPNFTQRAACEAYVQTEVLPAVRRTYERYSAIRPYGIVLGTRLQGTNTVVATGKPITVGAPGLGARAIRRAIAQMAERTVALGAIYVASNEDETSVLVQLEHKAFGDLVWTAQVVARRLEPFLGPVAITQAGLKPTRFLAHRWMS